MQAENWNEEFTAKVSKNLHAFTESEIIDDHDVRTLFRRHTAEILNHYRDNLQEPTGKLQDYLTAIDMTNQLLDEMSQSTWGYFNLLPVASGYITAKIFGGKYHFTGDMRDIMMVIKRDSILENGKKIFPQITCRAERDFSLLIKQYLAYFTSDNQFTFTHRSINLGLNLPHANTIMTRRFKSIDARIAALEQTNTANHQVNYRP